MMPITGFSCQQRPSTTNHPLTASRQVSDQSGPAMRQSAAARTSILCKAADQQPNSLPPEKLKALEALFHLSPNSDLDMLAAPETPRLSKPALEESAQIRQPFSSQDLRELISSSQQQSIHAGGDVFAINEFLCDAATLVNLKLDLESGRERLVQLVARQGDTITPIEGAFSDPDYGEMHDILGHHPAFSFHDASPFNLGTSHINLSQELNTHLHSLASKIGFDLHQHNAHQLCDYLANVSLSVRTAALDFDEDTTFHLAVQQGKGKTDFHEVTPLLT